MCERSNHYGCRSLLRHHRSSADSFPCGEGGGDAGAARRQLVGHWVLYQPQQLVGSISCSHTQLVQQLD